MSRHILGRLLCQGRRVSSVTRTLSSSKEEIIVRSSYQEITIPQINIPQYVWKKWEQWPEHIALRCGVTGRSYTYRQAREITRRFAMALLSSGLRPGQVIACVLPNSPETPLIALGALEAGLVLTTINHLYKLDEIVNQLRDSGSVAVVTNEEKLSDIFEAKKKLYSVNKHQGETLRLIVVGDSGGKQDVVTFTEMCNQQLDTRDLDEGTPEHNDIALLPYSSGTTGLPKGVCLTHRNIVANFINLSPLRQIRPASKEFQEIVPMILPFFHIYGMSVVAFQTLHNGGQVITVPKFEENIFLKVLKDYKTTVLFVAPPLILYLGTSPKVTREHLQSVTVTLSGAAPVGKLDIAKCLEKSPKDISYIQGYGLTECSPAVACQPAGSTNYSSVGSPVANTLLKVVDVETGVSLPADQEGEICVKGPQVMKCYLNNPKATEEAIDKDNWFHTGDIGYYDKNGDFYVTERLKELIKVKGFQVAPAELEEILRGHPSVHDAGIIGVGDKKKGEVPVAFVSLKQGSMDSSIISELKSFLNEKVAEYKQIQNFVLIETIPRSASGKILRRELKHLYNSKNN